MISRATNISSAASTLTGGLVTIESLGCPTPTPSASAAASAGAPTPLVPATGSSGSKSLWFLAGPFFGLALGVIGAAMTGSLRPGR